MAEGTREEAKQRRAEGREQRRSMLTEPFERLDDESGGGDGSSGTVDVRETLKRAALTAAAAAAVGAAAGAAKALLDRRGGTDGDAKDDQPNTQDEPEARAEPADEDEDDEPQDRADPAEEDDEDEPEARAEPTDDEEEEEQQGRAEPAEEDEEDEPEAQAEPADEEQQGRVDLEDAANADSDPREIVPKAREELERLLGREVESVSGFERRDGHWSVMLEVVEMRRIPDSSDVLASYEVTLDDDGRLAQMTRRRRYHRSEVEVG